MWAVVHWILVGEVCDDGGETVSGARVVYCSGGRVGRLFLIGEIV